MSAIRWSKVVKLGLVTPELEAARNTRLAAKKAGDKAVLAAAKKAFGEAFKAACAAKSLDYLRLLDAKESAAEMIVAHKEVDKALTKGGTRDKRKVTPFTTNSYGTLVYVSVK